MGPEDDKGEVKNSCFLTLEMCSDGAPVCIDIDIDMTVKPPVREVTIAYVSLG